MQTNDLLALQFVLSFIDAKTLLTAAMNGFDDDNERDKDCSDVCYKAIKAFL